MNRIVAARNRWIDALHTKNIFSILECYHSKHLFKGTMNHIVTDRVEDTKEYFKKFISNQPVVTFVRSDIKKYNDTYIDYGTYAFQLKNEGFIYANYQFIYILIDDNPKIISHFSSKI